jgi:hypothetical protein
MGADSARAEPGPQERGPCEARSGANRRSREERQGRKAPGRVASPWPKAGIVARRPRRDRTQRAAIDGGASLKPQERKPDASAAGGERSPPPCEGGRPRRHSPHLQVGDLRRRGNAARCAEGWQQLSATAGRCTGEANTRYGDDSARAHHPRQPTPDQRHGRSLHGPAASRRRANL